MPAILAELIEMILEAKEADSVLEGFDAVATKFMGPKYKLLKKAINGMSGAQEVNMRKAIGEHFTKRIKAHFGADTDKHKPIPAFDVSGNSSWVRIISWSPILGTLSLTVQDGKRQNNPYKLPFFPRSAVIAIQEGASPGKTLWRRYWRIVGKGKFHNKAKNLFKVKATQKAVKIVGKGVPSLKLPKKTPQNAMMKNLIKKPSVKTANIPKTGAKGVKITIKAPKIRKY